MNEAEWLAGTDSTPMLEVLRASGKASDRKLRLFAVACCRSIWQHMPYECSRQAVEVGEQYADGLTNDENRHAAWEAIRRVKYSALTEGDLERAAHLLRTEVPVYDTMSRETFCTSSLVDGRDKCLFLRDIFGNPFRPTPTIAPSVFQWDSGTVLRLAEAVYGERLLPSGHLDPARLAVLADALEEAGCTDAELLQHLRGPGPHVRGCHLVDSLLGQE
jgi:hypothetical protein